LLCHRWQRILANEDGSVSQRLIDYYVARARGGVGLIITGKVVTEITPEGVAAVGKKGKQDFIRAHKVVLAIGQSPVGNELKKTLEDKGIDVRVIGDAYNVGKIIDAVSSGFQAAWQI